MLPLEGIRVIDMTHVLAGPFATHQLHMLGAEVIKIEPPGGGDVMRGAALRPELKGLAPGFVALNCGKRSVAVDVKIEAGRTIVKRLVENAHVFIENFRPGKAARLGLSANDIRAINRNIVYCSISGWGQYGPNAPRPAYDHVIQAATGMMLLQGDDPVAAPVKVGFPVVDVATGLVASQAILAALLRRQRGDRSAIALDVSMVDASLLLMGGMVANIWLTGQEPKRVGNRGFVGGPGADTFPTADGWIATGANTLGQFESMCAVLGRPHLASDRSYLPRRPESRDGLLTDLGNPDLRAELVRAFQADSSQAWEEKLNAAGVAAAAVRTLADYLNGPYARTPGITARLPRHPLQPGKPAQVLSEGFRWSGGPERAPAGPPSLGQDTAAVLLSLGYSSREIDDLVKCGVIGGERRDDSGRRSQER